MDFLASWYHGANNRGPGNISNADFTGLEKMPKLKKLQLNRNWNLVFVEFPGVCATWGISKKVGHRRILVFERHSLVPRWCIAQSRMFYGTGGPCALFAEKDARWALAKMSFEEKDLTRDIEGLGPIWITFPARLGVWENMTRLVQLRKPPRKK